MNTEYCIKNIILYDLYVRKILNPTINMNLKIR